VRLVQIIPGIQALIAESIRSAKCGLCGSEGPAAVEKIAQAAQADTCPLCGSQLEEEIAEMKQQEFERLQIIDAQLRVTRANLDQVLATRARVTSELDESKRALTARDGELASFEQANKLPVDGTKVPTMGDTEMDLILQRYHAQMNELIRKKEQAYELRDIKRRELTEHQRRLEKQYVNAEEQFVPSFKKLANSFLGLDLDVRMESHKGTTPEVNLLLEVCGTERRQLHHLSESQRFFIDIALRMALAQYMNAPETLATLYIDTPEGSLDIAYESRAGDMFAQFVRGGHKIIMTANINTSQLLKRLAERCGESKMRLQRMTFWTDLSQVQIQEQQLFEHAYVGIETALRSEGQG
jgi:DNA repair exonuclease SbcCD ATPase subunit